MITDPGDGDALALLERLAERASVRPMLHGPGTALVLGGARSGKSTWAEQQLEGCEDVEYVATSIVDPDDAEWVERVALHRARRPAGWRTTETVDLPAVLGADDPAPVLLDCLAVWLDRVLFESGAWDDAEGWRGLVEERVSALDEALATVRMLEEKGYNPINQLVGYILSEDPTYITTYKNARAIIRRIDRDDLLQALVRDFVKH